MWCWGDWESLGGDGFLYWKIRNQIRLISKHGSLSFWKNETLALLKCQLPCGQGRSYDLFVMDDEHAWVCRLALFLPDVEYLVTWTWFGFSLGMLGRGEMIEGERKWERRVGGGENRGRLGSFFLGPSFKKKKFSPQFGKKTREKSGDGRGSGFGGKLLIYPLLI